ncbi:MAG: asparaginase [Solirubrobacteraceae bacterium]
MQQALQSLTRPIRLLAAGGTIAMRGERAVPVLDAAALVSLAPELAGVPALTAETLLSVPSAQLTLADALVIAARAAQAAAAGEGVVVTSGTDTLEELAVLCALLHRAPAPIVLTGANRPASRPGADGAANLLDAVAVAGAAATAELGAVVVFGGEVHAAMSVRKVDSTGPAAFGSPITGPLGRVVEGRVWLAARPVRPAALTVARLAGRVDVITATLGDDGALLRESAANADGIVLVAFGAGHLSPTLATELRRAAARLPVVITCRPERSSMLFDTYGFDGAERDLRTSGALCAPFLSPVAARIALLACLGAGLQRAQIAALLAPWDAT